MRLLVPLLFAAVLSAQSGYSVQKLIEFLRSSISLKQPDREVAKFLAGMKLSERLDDRTIEELQGEGLGPKTVAALHSLRDATASLPEAKPAVPAPKPVPIPPPSSEEQGRIIGEVRENSLSYTKNLPDFICLQVTRRFYDPNGMEFWLTADTIATRLSYFNRHEEYKLVSVNNQVTNQSYQSLGGATSSGEFGSMLRQIFEPQTHTSFEWDHWATLRKRRMYVFAFRVPLSTSQYQIDFDHKMDIVVGYSGLLYVDKETNMVVRIKMKAEDIPPSFPVQMATTQLDYDFTKIGDRDYLLPLVAEVRMRHDKFLVKNVVEFRLYRKFAADAEIKFDTPPPLSEDQTKEQPPKQ
jgi:hypothetical protein